MGGISLRKLLAAGAVSATALLTNAAAFADSKINMTRGVTPTAHEVYDIHMIVLWICVVASVVVYGVMFYSIFAFRKSKHPVPAKFHENATLEVLWTLVPAVVLILMAVPATKAMINLYDTSDHEMTVKVTGYQWKWEYEYLDSDIRFFSNLSTPDDQIYGDAEKGEHYLLEVDNDLVVPVETKIRFVITANDVLHAWWVPELGWKQDAIPGFINENWAYIEEPGVYRGKCAELCGRNHGFMPIVVRALPKDEYAAWVESKKQEMAAAEAAAGKTFTKDELMAQGQTAYATHCLACHQANGQGIPGAFPGLAGSALVKDSLADHIDIVLNGKAGTAMQAFGPQLNDVDLAAILTYERNAWGNDAIIEEGTDIVQPADIQAARGAVASAGQ